jgi:orotidine-5'-phosphate decarboxylase
VGFGARVLEAVRRAGTPLVLGIDPRREDVPPACSLDRFCRTLVDLAAEERLAAVKPQVAFFEALGPAGMAGYAELLAYARERGVLAIADVKRGDIGSTAEAYAAAFFGPRAPFRADAITASPYLGGDSLDPLIRAAEGDAAGVFVLVRTSNPGAADLQELADAGGRPLFERVAALVAARAEATRDASGYGAVGAVVGATSPAAGAALRRALPSAVLLAPGVGAQGARAADLGPFFDPRGEGALVPVSRAISGAWRERPEASGDWKDACRAAIRRLRAELTAAVASAGTTGA